MDTRPGACRSIADYGAVADTTVNSAAAIQRAIDAASAAGGGTVRVPAGQRFMCGSFSLKSRAPTGSRRRATSCLTP